MEVLAVNSTQFVRLPTRRQFVSAVFACGVAATTGCLSFDKATVSISGAAVDENKVLQVTPIWASGVVVQPDPSRRGAPTPGFAARLYCFGRDQGYPVEADGSFTVYLYDDPEKAAANGTALEIWHLDPDTMQTLYKKDALGAGYNLWLPWSTFRRDLRQVCFVVHYQPKIGREIWSQHIVVPLDPNNTTPQVKVKTESRRGDQMPKLPTGTESSTLMTIQP
jgi:hypothetical protein